MKMPPPIVIVFFLHALAQGGMFSRIPDMQLALGLNEAQLGLALLGQPAGAILSFLVSSQVVERVGTRTVMLTTIPLLALVLVGIALAPSLILMGVGFAVFGAAFALSNIALNVEADRVEAASGRRLMNTCHGIWSIGVLTASLIGTAMRGFDISPAVHFAVILVPVLVGMALFGLPMQPAPARPHSSARTGFRIALPTPMTLLLLGYAFGASLLEGGLRNWSVIFMRDSFVAPDWVDTLTLPAFMTAQSVGRLLADRAVHRWGPVQLARGLTVTALIGLLLVVFSPNLIVALCGFTLIGFGVCVSFPLSTSAAARLGDRPASENVAALTMSQQLLLLGAPALLGWIASTASIRITFAVLLPPLLLAFYLARYLAPKTPPERVAPPHP
ncbi:MAG: MFS transporter [Devosia sp.]|nr:MFS transporter [Devosia sp.]